MSQHDSEIVPAGPTVGSESPPTSFRSAYEDRYVALVRLAYLLTSDEGTAEELVQDAFAKALPRWPTIQNPGAYLRTSVVNGANSWIRRAALARTRAPTEDVHTELGANHLQDVLAHLPERQRAVLVLRYYEQLEDREIARILGCRPATVRTSAFRALAQLRKELPA